MICCTMAPLAQTGTKIKYHRSALLRYSNSPVARTPPRNLPVIPGITKAAASDTKPQVEATSDDEHDGEMEKDKKSAVTASGDAAKDTHDDSMVFEME